MRLFEKYTKLLREDKLAVPTVVSRFGLNFDSELNNDQYDKLVSTRHKFNNRRVILSKDVKDISGYEVDRLSRYKKVLPLSVIEEIEKFITEFNITDYDNDRFCVLAPIDYFDKMGMTKKPICVMFNMNGVYVEVYGGDISFTYNDIKRTLFQILGPANFFVSPNVVKGFIIVNLVGIILNTMLFTDPLSFRFSVLFSMAIISIAMLIITPIIASECGATDATNAPFKIAVGVVFLFTIQFSYMNFRWSQMEGEYTTRNDYGERIILKINKNFLDYKEIKQE